MTVPPPRSEAELLERAEAMAGRALRDVARGVGVAPPGDPRRAKGWAGRLLELALGATAGSRAEPDFPHLGVELKSIPLDARGRPLEGTYVCTAPLDVAALGTWDASWVRAKLSRVLWVPVVGEGPPDERRVGAPVMWSPSTEEEATLRADFEEFAQLLAEGTLWQIDGRRGRALQLRPKAADGDETTWAVDEDAGWVRQTPRGFYLRPSFTRAILARHLLIPE